MRTQWNGLRTSLVRNLFISPEIIDPKFVINMPVDAIASSRLIYATTPRKRQRISRDLCNNTFSRQPSPALARLCNKAQ
ncbi:MAG: hypothetical protein VB140_03725 [Burkholderia sp.]